MSCTNCGNREVSPPEDIAEFRQVMNLEENFVMPEIPEKRKTTDFGFLIVFGVCLLVLVPFLIYTFAYTDIDRLNHGYDECGNVCGKNNPIFSDIPCSGQDMEDKPLLKLTYNHFVGMTVIRKQCLSKCPSNFSEVFNRCLPKSGDKLQIESFIADFSNSLNKNAGYVVLLSFIGLSLAIGMLMLFRHFTAATVWINLIGSLLAFFALTGLLWFLVSTGEETEFMVPPAIIFTVITLFFTVLILCLIKRIKLVIRLMKEATQVIFGMPLILCEPILTIISNIILFSIAGYFLLIMVHSGFLQRVPFNRYDYVPDATMIFAIWYHLIIVVWMAQFIMGCQHMVVSGAVSSYYFSRNKLTLDSPIYTSFYNLVRYHLGTVALGSLIISAVTILKILIRVLIQNRLTRCLVDCCMRAIENFIRYLTKNAYIQTALHGQPFCKSGKRAVKLLVANAISALTVNSLGNFVLFNAKLLILLITGFIGLALNYEDIANFWPVVVVGLFVTAIITHSIFTVFETTIDTLFICYCEDNCMNDGVTQQYYMTINLMRYMEDAKATAKPKQ